MTPMVTPCPSERGLLGACFSLHFYVDEQSLWRRSMLEGLRLCEEIADRLLNWMYTHIPRQGDHIWWISDTSKFEAHYPEWSLTYDVPLLCQEIYEANVERWEAMTP